MFRLCRDQFNVGTLFKLFAKQRTLKNIMFHAKKQANINKMFRDHVNVGSRLEFFSKPTMVVNELNIL
jgi:hypothetical protein